MGWKREEIDADQYVSGADQLERSVHRRGPLTNRDDVLVRMSIAWSATVFGVAIGLLFWVNQPATGYLLPLDMSALRRPNG